MEVINAKSALLSNLEVMMVLEELKDSVNKKNKQEETLAPVASETLKYLQETDCKYQTPELMQKFLMAVKKFKLTKMEKLMMVNNPPRNELEFQLIVQDSEERLSEEEVQQILEAVKEHLPSSPDA